MLLVIFTMSGCTLCNSPVRETKLNKHQSKHCNKRPIKCEWCDETTPYDVWLGYHGNECEKYKTKCRFCLTRYFNHEICQHLNECLFARDIVTNYTHHLGSKEFVKIAEMIKEYRKEFLTSKPLLKFKPGIVNVINHNGIIDLFICIRQFSIPSLLDTISLNVSKLGNINYQFLLDSKKFLGDELTISFLKEIFRKMRIYDYYNESFLGKGYGSKEEDIYGDFRLERYYIPLDEKIHGHKKEIIFDIVYKKKAKRIFIKSLRSDLCDFLSPDMPNIILRYLFDEYIIH